MQRREFVTFIGGAAIVVPLGVHAEQPAMPVIGFLSSRSANDFARQVDAFRGALREAGFIEGKDIAIDYSWADGQYDRLPRQAADLVDRYGCRHLHHRPGGTRGQGAAERLGHDVSWVKA